VSEEGGYGEGTDSEEPSLLSYTFRYVSLVELGNVCQVGFREPIHLCTSVRKEGGDGEGTDTEESSLLSYTLRLSTTGRVWDQQCHLSCHTHF
jgi:hypothetical protein